MHTDTRKAVALLAYVALEGDQSREALAALLWPESTDARARAALRRTLSVLNRALDGRWLDSRRTRVALRGDDLRCDVTAFRDAAGRAGHDHGEDLCDDCVARLERAAALYRGDFLSGFTLRDSAPFDEWMIVETEALRRECSGVLERLVDALAAAGRLDDAIVHARRLVGLDPLHEPAHRRLMQLYAWNGRRSDAVRQYRDCVATLDRELGVRPLDDTVELYQAILEDRVGSAPRPVRTRLDVDAGTTAAPARRPPPASATPLVGRDDEMARLLRCYGQVDDDGRLLVIAGEAGIGKTRLGDELVARVVARGAGALTVRCQPGDQGLAYAPVAEALRDAAARPDLSSALETAAPHWRSEAGRLVPAIAPGAWTAPPEPLTSPGAQARFVEGVWQVLAAAVDGDVAGMVVVDDLQWADDATLQLLTYVVTRLRGRRLALLCCWRDDELVADHPWLDTVRATRDRGLAEVVRLDRLGVDHIATLLAATDAGDATTDRLAARLHAEAEGLPLAVVAYLEELGGHGDADDWPMPHSLEQLFRTRVAGLDQTARQVLTAAAAIGRSFDFDTAMAASGRTDGETVAALEALTARGMVRELDEPAGPPLFDFTHDKLRSVVYADASLARRRLLHGRVADALRSRARTGDQPAALAGLVARHEQLAGRDERAAEMYAAAGARARSLYANGEALDHLHRALALGHPDAAALHEAIGDLETLRGDYRAALVSYDTAAGTATGGTLATLEHKSARVHLRAGDVAAALARLDAAGTALRGATADPGLRARIAADRSLAAARTGAFADAELDARRALDLAEQAADRHARAQARNILGLLARRTGRLDEAERQLEHSARLAGELPEPDARITALNNLALVLGDARRYDDALEHALTAAQLCERIGDRHGQAALHNNIADLLHAAGREEEAMTHLTTAVRLFAEVGEQAGTAPEIWKLVDW